MSSIPELPVISPVWAIVVLVIGLALALGLDYYQDRRDRQRLFRRGPAAAQQALSMREQFSRAEDRLTRKKSARKEIRDILGSFLGGVAVLVRGKVPLRPAMQRVSESYPPNALCTLIEESVAAGAAGDQFFADLYARAVKTGYDPLIITVVKLQMIQAAGGDLTNALRQSGRRADKARMHELKMAAQQIQVKMSALAVFCLLPAIWIITIMPQLMQAMQAFTGIGQ